MAYFIAVIFCGGSFLYMVSFTSLYGWVVSWVWFESGMVAVSLHFTVYDLLFSVGNWLLYQVPWLRKVGIVVWQIRQIK